MHFSCFTYTGLCVFFQNRMHTFRILKERPVSVCELKCLNLLCMPGIAIGFGNRKSVVFMAKTSLMLSSSLQMLPVSLILCKQVNIIEENVFER